MAFYPHAEANSVYPDTVRYRSDDCVITQQDLWDHMSGTAWAPWRKSPTVEHEAPSQPHVTTDVTSESRSEHLSRRATAGPAHSRSFRNRHARSGVRNESQAVRKETSSTTFSWSSAAAGSALEYMPVSTSSHYVVELDDLALENPSSWVGHCRRVIGTYDEICSAVVARLAPELAHALTGFERIDLSDEADVQALARHCSRETQSPVVVIASTRCKDSALWRHAVASCSTLENGRGFIVALTAGHVELLEPPPSTWNNVGCCMSHIVCGAAGYLSNQTPMVNRDATHFISDSADVSWHITDRPIHDLIDEVQSNPFQRSVHPAAPQVIEASIATTMQTLGFFNEQEAATLHMVLRGVFAVGLGLIVCSARYGFRYVVPCPVGGSEGKLLARGGTYVAYDHTYGLACATPFEYGSPGCASASGIVPLVHQFRRVTYAAGSPDSDRAGSMIEPRTDQCGLNIRAAAVTRVPRWRKPSQRMSADRSAASTPHPTKFWRSALYPPSLETPTLIGLPVNEWGLGSPALLSADLQVILGTTAQSPNACCPLSIMLDEDWRASFPERDWVYVPVLRAKAKGDHHCPEYAVVRTRDGAPKRIYLGELGTRPVTAFRTYATSGVTIMAALFQEVYGVARPNLRQDEALLNTVHAFTTAHELADAMVVAVLEGPVERRPKVPSHSLCRRHCKVGMKPAYTVIRGFMVRRDAPGVTACERAGFEDKWALTRGPTATSDVFRWLHDAYYRREPAWSHALDGRGPSDFRTEVMHGIHDRVGYCHAWQALLNVRSVAGEAADLASTRLYIRELAMHDTLRRFVDGYLSAPNMALDPVGLGMWFPPDEPMLASTVAARDPHGGTAFMMD